MSDCVQFAGDAPELFRAAPERSQKVPTAPAAPATCGELHHTVDDESKNSNKIAFFGEGVKNS